MPVQMRVGVNTGEVLVGAMRAGGESTVMGDVVNTAQRLQTIAEPGEVIVGSSTQAATRECVEYEALGLLSVRGRDEPVEAYRAVRVLAPPGRRRRGGARAPMLGRDDEIDTLRHVLQMATTAQPGATGAALRRRGRGQEPARERSRATSRAKSSARACCSVSACRTATRTSSVRLPRRSAARAASKDSRGRAKRACVSSRRSVPRSASTSATRPT